MKTSYRIIIPLLIGSLLSGCTPNDNIDPDDSNVYCEQAYPGSTGETVELTISGETITCAKINEEYIFQGDILLQTPTRGAVYAEGDLWPNNTVYYTINSNLPDKERVTQAIEYYHTYTNLTFIERTNQSNYIDFIYDANGCSSYLGMIGGRQPIRLANWGTKGNVIHEIGHAIGLLHEHSKVGRDQYVNIIEENIQNGTQHNFTEFSSSNPNTNGFDFESIMLYSSYAFSKNGKATIVKKNGEVFNTQRSRLSEDDLEIINEIYPGKPTGATFTDSRDGKVYKMVTIGSQVWMAENLAYLPSVGPATSESYRSPYYYVYDYYGTDVDEAKATANYTTYGVLYNWPATMHGDDSSEDNPSDVQGICPTGWHLPSDAEWTELATFLANNGYNYDGSIGGGGSGELGVLGKIAKSMAKDSGWGYSDIAGAVGNTDYPGYRNKSGFSALPSGGNTGGGFSYIGYEGFWWSSTENDTDTAWYWFLGYRYDFALGGVDRSKAFGFSVRCVRNNNLLAVTTGEVTNITTTTASCSGNVTSDGGSSVTARGFCWSTSENPTISNSKTTDGRGLGTYTRNITGLSPNTTYYVRAYATNAQGTAYGKQKPFRTYGNTFTDSRDSKVYKTVTIGEQVWMAENLAYLPSVVGSGTGSDDYGHETDPYYYVYDYYGTDVDEAKAYTFILDTETIDPYTTYGVLYNWPAAMNGAVTSSSNPSGVQGICPTGWHLPSDAEWQQLEIHLGMSQEEANNDVWRGTDEGGKMKETGTSHWLSVSEGTTNESGFTALPGGYRRNDGGFFINGYDGYWWSSTENSTNYAWNRSLGYSYDSVCRGCNGKAYGFSVRCIKD
jgi:uncharacterized protein (TIGR02145 family)